MMLCANMMLIWKYCIIASVQEGDSEDGLPSANAGRQTDADERHARALSFPL